MTRRRYAAWLLGAWLLPTLPGIVDGLPVAVMERGSLPRGIAWTFQSLLLGPLHSDETFVASPLESILLSGAVLTVALLPTVWAYLARAIHRRGIALLSLLAASALWHLIGISRLLVNVT